uniref:Tnp_DDE_dom domain-containing protein n=1 Tax=Macrostomum lignano TaxID=282301 RepID=A0A1I8FNQ5_9PLAT
ADGQRKGTQCEERSRPTYGLTQPVNRQNRSPRGGPQAGATERDKECFGSDGGGPAASSLTATRASSTRRAAVRGRPGALRSVLSSTWTRPAMKAAATEARRNQRARIDASGSVDEVFQLFRRRACRNWAQCLLRIVEIVETNKVQKRPGQRARPPSARGWCPTYGLTHLSTGELLRTRDIALGAGSAYRSGRTMLNNDLVPAGRCPPTSPGFLINGCPKDREQAMAFEMMLVRPAGWSCSSTCRKMSCGQRLMRRGSGPIKRKLFRKDQDFQREDPVGGEVLRGRASWFGWTVQATVSEVFSRVRDGLMNFRPKTASKQEAHRRDARHLKAPGVAQRGHRPRRGHRRPLQSGLQDAEIKSNKTSDSIQSTVQARPKA